MLVSVGAILILSASAIAIIALFCKLFPGTEKLMPEGWGAWFTFKTSAYALLLGLLLLLIGG